MVATELKYLAGDKTMSARVIREAARQVALERFEQMRAGKINPKTFMAAESRASREAYSKLVAGGSATAHRGELAAQRVQDGRDLDAGRGARVVLGARGCKE